ncbi:uncharacterized protein LOC116181251 isoform X2 [Photinus pyralis]|uniref:uncharacterized protein LOC116181251 isoform X2 n=1 Tax=Photinus pyralis TaxID=7054 RepID=UPI0012676B70|nr:uncharacterized protein LOC116181251 isoform X2 [Photinus pyralis]
MSTEGYDVNQSSQSDLVRKCEQNFYLTATIQGRLSYLLMSIHAVTPSICARLTTYNPGPILFYNMLYGVAAHLHCRPHMQLLGSFHRVAFRLDRFQPLLHDGVSVGGKYVPHASLPSNVHGIFRW